ncbi:MAG: T9SS type A sorting domain-containing protein [Ignavibacteriaceae bacterium]|nr:T9SS type A sorting domain-containing protein [Ignavibacteriaceae bacterium]
MNKKLFFFVLAFSVIALSQPTNWEWVATRPTGNSINDIAALPGGKVLFVGDNNTVLTTTDNGTNWNVIYPDAVNRSRDIYEVDFVNAQVGYASGTNGLLFKTTDGGVTWDTLSTGLAITFWYLDFIDADTGYVVGSSAKALKTTNGGATFTEIPIGSTSAVIYDVRVVRPDLIYLGTSSATPGRLLKSTDYGTTFLPVAGYTSTQTVREILFVNDNLGFTGTSGYTINRTTDGGATWTEQDLGTGTIYDIVFFDTLNGAAAGADGNVFVTSDGGVTWNILQTGLGAGANVYAIFKGTNPNELFAGTYGGRIARSTDKGLTWTILSQSLTLEEIRNVEYLNGKLYLCGGSTTAADSLGEVFRSDNEGATWTKLPFNPKYRIYTMDWINDNVAYFGVRSGTGIYKTTDGGVTATALSPGIMSSTGIWYDIQFLNESVGYAAGSSGVMVKTTDGGATWTEVVDPFGTSAIYKMDITDGQTIFIVGSSGKIAKSTDSGATWALQTSGTTSTLYDVDFVNTNIGFICGSSGRVLQTTDGGTTWTSAVTNSTMTLYSVRAFDSSRVIVGGSSGEILYTYDGGANWSKVANRIAGNTFYAAEFVSANVYLVGSGGNVIKGLFDPSIPVELTSFSADASGQEVVLNWTTATETNNLRFEIERKPSVGNWSKIGEVEGSGNSLSPRSYAFADKNVQPGAYSYRLKQVDYDGTFSYSGTVTVNTGVPEEYTLAQNYPNPFNPATVISYTIPVSGNASLKVYDMLGNVVATLVNEFRQAGSYSITFNADRLSSGVYYYSLSSGGKNITRKMMLVK